jgi:DNA phosphorothioation-dependent restriction protein DptH
MRALASALDDFLVENAQAALAHDQNASIRMVLTGPPLPALEELFNRLTANGATEWSWATAGGTITVPVLLVSYSRSISPPPGILSGWCHWDYAVTVRNSSDRLLILVSPDAVDRIPESLANTTEVFGGLRGKANRRWLDTVVWKYLVRQVSTRLGLPTAQVGLALREVAKQSANLAPTIRDGIVWQTVDVLLEGGSGLSAIDSLALAAGFPAIGAGGGTLDDAAKVLERLAKLIGRQGITSALDAVRSTQAIQGRGLVQAVDDLRLHLFRNAPSGMSFQEAPTVYYRPTGPPPIWWTQLNQSVLLEALNELSPPTPGRLTVICHNPLTSVSGVTVVASSVELQAVSPNAATLSSANFSRRVGRGAATALSPNANDPCRTTDVAPPTHDRPMTYQANALGFNDGTLRVISLDSFNCGGLASVWNADDNPVPTRGRGPQAWTQQIVLPRSGNWDVQILHCSSAGSIEITREDNSEGPWTRSVQPDAYETQFVLDIEDGFSYTVRILAPDNTELGTWSMQFNVQEIGDTPPTRFVALVTKHQQKGGRVAPARVIDSPLRRVEEAYLRSSDSWTPILACWPTDELGDLQLYWPDPKLGSAFPQLDPRPVLVPPGALLQAREAVRSYLNGTQRPIGEISFDDPALKPLIETYLAEYERWLSGGNADVTWFDAIAVHAAAPNDQVGGFLAYPEPSVILLSPLHPLRLAWHCCAHQMLVDAMSKPCPAAGLLDPSGCPDIGLWPLHQGHDIVVSRAFLSMNCEEPHWSVLVNRSYVGQLPIDLALARLATLGLRTRGLPGGFSRSQAFDSVDEVARLLPGRATLRVGLVGDRDETSASAKGVLSWCSINCDEEQDETVAPYSAEIFDMRRSAEPTAEQLATLAEETSERVRWFRVIQIPADSPQDLVLLDQLGADAPGGDKGVSRTPTGPAALVRIRTREDSRNAMQLKESRIGRLEARTADLQGAASSLCIAFENLAIQDANISHFTFRPVQQAIGSRLMQATYVAVTSTQIDPACIIRGTRSQQGYLWNYELPGALSGDEERAGYYLIASPTDAMLRAISQSAQLVASTPPPVRDLLDEISRRGIPILKRLAAGGSQARGELGLLLAVRFLQDAFRPGAARVGLPVWSGRCIHLILAVDPYETSFDALRRALRLQTSEQRPDLLVFSIRMPQGEEKIRIKITPVEVKFRQGQMAGTDMRDALAQASNLSTLLNELWVKSLPSNLWTVCSSGLLGQALELAFRIYADPTVHNGSPEDWTGIQERVISAVLNQGTEITVSAKGRLLVFDQSPQSATLDADSDSRFDTAVIGRQDASILLAGSGALSPQAEQSIGLLDFSFPDCGDERGGYLPSVNASAALETIAENEPSLPVSTEPVRPESPPVTEAPEAGSSVPAEPDDQATQQGTSPVPPEVRQTVRRAFQGFIGNEAAVRRIQNDLLRALIDRPPHLSKNFLFTGQPSTGKTEISRRMALALQLPFVKLDGRGLRSRERLFELIDGELGQQGLVPAQVGTQAGLPVLEYPALIVFIDEVHLVPRPIQESLLTMLEAADRSVTLQDRVALMRRTTFLFATTRASDVDAAFRSRCSEVQLKEYSREQVAEIVRLRFPHPWPESVYLAIAQLGRRVPRIALEMAKELETAITVAEDPTLTVSQHLDDVRRDRELDELGLTLTDVQYLSHLGSENRPVGEQTILNILGTVDRDRIVDEIEPFLRSLGFIRFGPRGREITEEGRDYLMERTRHGPRS